MLLNLCPTVASETGLVWRPQCPLFVLSHSQNEYAHLTIHVDIGRNKLHAQMTYMAVFQEKVVLPNNGHWEDKDNGMVSNLSSTGNIFL